jgi:quercetin dioxygenase-like cupin family protein
MKLQKYRWSKVYESAEEELTAQLQAKNIGAERWTADEYESFALHMHAKDKQLWCAEGSITFTVGGKPISLQAGDTLTLPANTPHQALAGMSGCVCYEFPQIADNPIIPIS